ncbi:universal stress protein [Cryobacterium sp. Hh11]|uniref:universal stress protein n=1 Tax=Cryobacterium sp. Hh11 TaxID=2555868 RepID=UPI00106CC257|nr:universal stress protein [Cryobacterium sp. Hh11]TFD50389.1 universal stress protein [Cryobacterium sp. Hh11]
MAETIVLALNGGTGSPAALDWVIERARILQISLELTTVIDLARLPTTIAKDRVLPAYEQMLMDSASRVRRDAPAVQVMTSVRRGAPLQELLNSAADADLLVIGTREAAGSLYGTLRHQIAAGVSCPLVIVPTDWTPRNGSVVVGVDDDETSHRAVAFAAREAERLGRELSIVHAWRIPTLLALGWLSAGASSYDEIRMAHAEVLAGVVERVRAEHPTLVVRDTLEQGSAALVLTGAAEHAEMVVVGTHGRRMIAGLLLGSIAHDLLISMPCPVVVVPHPADVPLLIPNAEHGK